MRERPIIMSGDHPVKCLDGTKTMTRRVIVPQPWDMDKVYFKDFRKDYGGRVCPYGQVGDRLWVRETLRRKRNDPSMGADYITYVSDFSPVLNPNPNQRGVILIRPTWQWQKDTLPSIYMPRWASRILLEITEIRVERLQEITKTDMDVGDLEREGSRGHNFGIDYTSKLEGYVLLSEFRELWDSLNAKRGYGWEVNPWVWVIRFRKLE